MMFVCVCIYIYILMVHCGHTRATRDQSGRRIERSTSAIGLPETASWLSRRWKWTANSESNQGMGAIIFIFFIMQSEALQGVCLQGLLALANHTHTHTRARDIAFFRVYGSGQNCLPVDHISDFFVFMTTRWNYLFIFIFLVSQLTTPGRVG
jgi:hypothetical protein